MFEATLNRAIQAGGGVISFARAMGVTHQAVYHWKKRGYVPLDKAARVQSLFGEPLLDLVRDDVGADCGIPRPPRLARYSPRPCSALIEVRTTRLSRSRDRPCG